MQKGSTNGRDNAGPWQLVPSNWLRAWAGRRSQQSEAAALAALAAAIKSRSENAGSPIPDDYPDHLRVPLQEVVSACKDLSRDVVRLRKMLADRDKMLRQAHHRFKNDLQVLASIASLRSRGMADPALSRAMADLRYWIHAMAAVYQALARDNHPSQIRADMFGPEICNQMAEPEGGSEITSAMVSDIVLDMNSAVVLAMLIVEAVRLARARRSPGQKMRIIIQVIRRRSGGAVLTVSDDGAALPDSPVDSMGQALIAGYVRQLHGTLTTCHGSGNAICVALPASVATA